MPASYATCTESGFTEGLKCSKCGEIITKQHEILPLGHDYVDHADKSATCTEDGYKAYQTCTRCDYTSLEQIKALGHSEEILPEIKATCTEAGLTEGKKCSVCGEILVAQKTIFALGHLYEGSNECSRCDYASAIPSKGLSYELSEDEISYIVKEIGTCTDTEIVIPYTYNNLPVTSIGKYAFSGCDSLTSVTIPNSVTLIGDDAFEDCTSLKYNEYDNALYLGNEQNPYLVLVKAKDKGITSCTINENARFVLDSAFSDCTSLTSVTIPNSVTSIDGYAFYRCSKLTIYCEATSEPSGWSPYWNSSNRPVVWGHTHSYTGGQCVCGTKEN